MKPLYFATPAAWRAWLAANHVSKDELLVGFYKRGSGRPSITWPESVDEALCYGWIDGIRRSIDRESYSIRFTPRRKGSIWSAVNIGRVAELMKTGRMANAGVREFEKRSAEKSAIYAYEQRKTAKLPPLMLKRMKANKRAWNWFTSEAPSYQQVATYWVISAKREDTREKRLARLIADSEAGRRIGPMAVKAKRNPDSRSGR